MTAAPFPTLSMIQAIITSHLGLAVRDLLLGQSHAEAEARVVFILVASDTTPLLAGRIGAHLARGTESIRKLCAYGRQRMADDAEFAATVAALCLEAVVDAKVRAQLGLRHERDLDARAVATAALGTPRGAMAISPNEIVALASAHLAALETIGLADREMALQDHRLHVAGLSSDQSVTARAASPVDVVITAWRALEDADGSPGERSARVALEKALRALAGPRKPHPQKEAVNG